jgi:hypothetical protein
MSPDIDTDDLRRWVREHDAALKRAAVFGGATFALVLVVVGIVASGLVLPLILYGGAIIAGIVTIPLGMILFPPLFKRPLIGKLAIALGLFTSGDSVLVELPDGNYRVCPVEDGRFRYEGEWYDLEGESEWSRLYWQKFGMTFLPTDDAMDRWEPETVQQARRSDTTLVGDGGGLVGPRESRGGHALETRHTGESPDGYLLDVHRVMDSLRGAGGIEASQNAVQFALEEYGGDTTSLEGKWWVIAVLFTLLAGAATGFVAFGFF